MARAIATNWLDADERQAWLALVRVMSTLPAALDAELERDAGLSFFEYTVLAMLSEEPSRTLRMNQLAEVTNSSASRLSHVAKRLEGKKLIRRTLDAEDARCTNAVLTAAGLKLVTATAPKHVNEVRSLVIDAVSGSQLKALRQAGEKILARVDPEATTKPLTP